MMAPPRSSRGRQLPQVLVDPDQNRRLLRDGFVKFRLCSSAEVAPLRESFLQLSGGRGSGFHSDLTVPDPEFRRATSATIAAALDQQVIAHFEGFTPFLRNFLCKYPGDESELYLHQDWAYIDERSGGRTYVAWIALEDIDHDNGQLQVLRSSHLLPRSPRGTDLTAPWLREERVIRERLLWIPVQAGECVVFDNSLVHCSVPNTTDAPRLVAAIGMRPEGAKLVHFRRSDDASATMHEVDEAFFLENTPQGLASDGIPRPPAEQVAVEPTDLDAAQLARMLDAPLLARLDRARHHARAVRHRAAEAAGRIRSMGADETNPSVPLLVRWRASARAWLADLPATIAIRVLRTNEAIIDRWGPATRAVWNPREFAWSTAVEDAWPEIRAEVESLLASTREIPHIEDVTGGIPQGNEGPWRSFVLVHQGRWIDWNCERCPRTSALVRSIPDLTMAGFSVLEPGTHITEHRGPNKGALRYQLGIIVPGDPGACRIRVGEEMLHWEEGGAVAFDFTVPHEAWNDSDGIRVLLMLEVLAPLSTPLDQINRLAQRAMGWFPTTRNIRRRLARLEPTLTKAPAG